MTEEEKQAKKEQLKKYYKKLKAQKDELLLENTKRGKTVANYYQKKEISAEAC